ncbi:unnamed protein product [Oreochromis niloticus]|nr:unnamed protein product [Mustela putorius furo]
MLLGNDIAGGLVLPRLEVLDNPLIQKTSDVSMHPGLYPACAITRAQARKDTDVDLSDSVLMSSFSEENDVPTNRNNVLSPPDSVKSEEPDPFPKVSSLPLTRDQLSAAQLADETLQSCFKHTRDVSKFCRSCHLPLHHDGPVQRPHHCSRSTNPSVDLRLPSPITREQDPEILKLLHLGQELIPDPDATNPKYSKLHRTETFIFSSILLLIHTLGF